LELAHGVLVIVEDDDVHFASLAAGLILPCAPRPAAAFGSVFTARLASPLLLFPTDPHPTRGDPMSLTMHNTSVPVFVRMFSNMLSWLDKAQAHAEARKFDSANYLGLRLAPDMLPLTKQIQIATDMAKACVARLSGVEVPKWDDNEATLDALRDRIRKTLDYVQSLPAAQIDGSEQREILLPMRAGEPMRFTGEAYLKHYVLPNLYFHATTTYALLRHAGVELGKRDYLGAA
jgi:hypothetical protein